MKPKLKPTIPLFFLLSTLNLNVYADNFLPESRLSGMYKHTYADEYGNNRIIRKFLECGRRTANFFQYFDGDAETGFWAATISCLSADEFCRTNSSASQCKNSRVIQPETAFYREMTAHNALQMQKEEFLSKKDEYCPN